MQALKKRLKIGVMPYRLEIQIPENDPQDIIVQESLSIGSDPSNDICLQDFGLAPKHCIFRQQQGVLTILNIGGSKPFKIGKQKLELGKTYILDDNDKIQFGDLVIVIDEFEPSEDIIEDELEEDLSPSLGTPSADLAPDPDEEEEIEDQGYDPTSINVAEMIAKAKEESGKHDIQEIKKGLKKQKEKTHWDELPMDLDDEDEEDEDTDEKTSSKLMQLTRRLKQILVNRPKRDHVVKAEPIKKIVTKSPRAKAGKLENIPGFIPRFFAFAFNLTLTGLVVQTIFDVPSAVILFTDLLDKTHLAIAKMPEISFVTDLIKLFTPEVLASILVYYILEFIFALLLGRSLGYTLLGIYENSGFITSRIKAIIRTSVGLFTFPFIIFDAPAFFRRRSLKEVLSLSSLGFHQTFIGYLTTLILLPALLMVFLLADAFNKKDMLLTWQYQELPPMQQQISQKALPFLGVNLSWQDEWSESALPSLSPAHVLERFQEKDRQPRMGITLIKEDSQVSLYPGPQYSAQDWFKIFNSRNLPVRLINPEWQEFIELSPAQGPVAPVMRDQMRLLFLAGFTDYLADPLNLIEYIRVFGPLLPPIETWRNSFMNTSSLKPGDQLRWVRNSGRDLLIKQHEKEDLLFIEHYFLDQTPFKSILLVGSKKDQAFLEELSQNYLQQARPLRVGVVGQQEQEELTPSLELTQQLSQWMDHLLRNKVAPTEENLEALYELFFVLSGETLGLGEDHPLQQQLNQEISRFQAFLESTEVEEAGLELKNKLQQLFEAYQQKRSSFFMRDSYNTLDNIE